MSNRDDLLRRLASGGVVFDGAMGSMLIAKGLGAGHAPEEWNLDRPGEVAAVHRAYLDAGAEVVTTNTFGATPSRLERHALADRVADVTRAGVGLAREAIDASAAAGCAERRFVAVSVGPTGRMLPPLGDATEASVAREFEAQLASLTGGFDLVLVETMFDAREALVALRAAREIARAPVAVSMTYMRTPRGFFTMMGDAVAAASRRLEDAGADVVACNCSISSGDMLDVAPLVRAATGLPVLCQPNAGQPRMEGATPVYDQTPAAFGVQAAMLFDLGVNAVGGCCGTTPEFIRELCRRREGQP